MRERERERGGVGEIRRMLELERGRTACCEMDLDSTTARSCTCGAQRYDTAELL